MSRIFHKWTAGTLREALARVPDETRVSFDGCGCCVDDDAGLYPFTDTEGRPAVIVNAYWRIDE